MKIILILVISLFSLLSFGQYPFEKYQSPNYLEYNDRKLYDWSETKHTVNHTITIEQFYDNNDTLTIQLTTFTDDIDKASVIRIFRNKTQIQKMTVNMFFNQSNTSVNPIRVADINGDGLRDLKIIVPFMGNGLAALNVEVIYLFQTGEGKFIKISYADMMIDNRPERDLDSDGNFEIITMNLNSYESHNYWTFNLFEYKDEELKNANQKDDYPIMIQYLFRDNYEITNNISREKMKGFELKLPIAYDIQK
jgi:hypothetical protein